MKRFKLIAILGIAVLALASCDAMLLAFFPEFDKEGNPELYGKTITVAVTIPAGYNANAGVTGEVRLAVVKWYFDELGLFVITDAGGLDFSAYAAHEKADVDAPTGQGNTGAGALAQVSFTIVTPPLPPDNYAVILYDDEDMDGRPSLGDTAVFVTRPNPAPWTDAEFEFDLVELTDDQPTMNANAETFIHSGDSASAKLFSQWSQFL